MYIYYIGIGSNLGDREGYLAFAVSELTNTDGVCSVSHSSWIETPPWGPVEQGPFLNGILKVESTLTPLVMLDTLLHIERLAGRQREIHWGPRTLDLDIILAFDEAGSMISICAETLTIPHPYFWDRTFVLEPLHELLPTFTYKGISISERLATLSLA